MVSFQYKWDPSRGSCTRKALCTLRADLMATGVHYEPAKTQCPTAEKSTARFLIALGATHA